jgi:hypothetical protein
VVQSQPRQIVHKTLSWKYLIEKKAGRVAQVIKCLPSKHEALSLNSSTPKRKVETCWYKIIKMSTRNDIHTILGIHELINSLLNIMKYILYFSNKKVMSLKKSVITYILKVAQASRSNK